MSQRQQLHQVAVALGISGQKDQVVRAPFSGASVMAAAIGDVYLAADDRFDAGFFACRVKVDHTVKGAVVGDG